MSADSSPDAALLQHALEVARAAAAESAELIRTHYRGNFVVRDKADATPVTGVDEAAERIVRRHIGAAFPEHGIYGEEFGASGLEQEWLWLIDPIDGTRSFVRGYPFFSTQIALMQRGRIMVGVSSAPAFDELAWAVRGQGAFLNGQALAVAPAQELATATLSTGNLRSLSRTPGWQVLGQLTAEVARNRGYGDFYHYHLLAAGRIDLVIESDVNILDIAALALIVEEAGGRFTDLHGASVTLETRSVLAAAPLLHELVLERFLAVGDGSGLRFD